MIDRTFRNINTLFLISFKNADDDPSIIFLWVLHTIVEIKDFNTLIDHFFIKPLKNK